MKREYGIYAAVPLLVLALAWFLFVIVESLKGIL